MRRFVNRLKRVAGRLTNLYKPRPWWLKRGEKEEKGKKKRKEKRVKKLAWVRDAELAKEDGGLQK